VSEQELLRACAQQVAELQAELANYQTEREQSLAHLTVLNNVATALSRSLDFDQRLGIALTACREAMAADAALIYLIDADPQALSLVVSDHGRPEPSAGFVPQQQWRGGIVVRTATEPSRIDGMRETGSLTLARADGFSAESVATLQATPLQLGQGQLAGVALDGEARAIADLRAVPLLHPELIQRERLISGAFVALHDTQQITGALGIYTRARRLFTEADMRLLTSLASQVGMSLYNARLHEQVRRQAQHDGLTGLFNRGHLMELAAREYQRARRHRSPLIVLMIDVDQFKAVNDSSGHVAGDRALQAVARMLREQTRSFDLVGRYGGDEFVVVLIDCTHAYAFEVIRRLHQAAQAIRVPTDTGPLTLTLSIGMAACKLKENETLEQVLAHADREMYALKDGSASGSFSLPATG
jgi:diguanylate cyclase (GGDEF)-like protein